jgi:type VI protein secretion system component VasK
LTKLGQGSEKQKALAQRLAREFADKTARNEKRTNPNSNVDKNNIVILEAEIKNLELSLDDNRDIAEQKPLRSRIQSLKDKLKNLKAGILE